MPQSKLFEAEGVKMSGLVLENENLRLEFNRENGALTSLTAVKTGWEIMNRPELGLSYRLLVPMKGKRNNPVLGEKQKVSGVNIAKDHRTVTFT